MTHTPTTKMLYHEGTGTLIHMAEPGFYLIDLDLIDDDEMDDFCEMPHLFVDRGVKVSFTNAKKTCEIVEI